MNGAKKQPEKKLISSRPALPQEMILNPEKRVWRSRNRKLIGEKVDDFEKGIRKRNPVNLGESFGESENFYADVSAFYLASRLNEWMWGEKVRTRPCGTHMIGGTWSGNRGMAAEKEEFTERLIKNQRKSPWARHLQRGTFTET